MKLFALGFGIFLMSGFFVGLSSCQKETTCIASIKCIDSVGNAVPEANVMLFALVKSADGKRIDTADIRTSGITNGDGEIKFTFRLPAIYDISATKMLGTKKLSGLSVIKLEEGQTVVKNVNMYIK